MRGARPGLTNSLTGVSEALLDSVPMVVLVGDVANGAPCTRHFRSTAIDNIDVLRPVTKEVFAVQHVTEIPVLFTRLFSSPRPVSPGRSAWCVPWNLLSKRPGFSRGRSACSSAVG